MHKGITYSADQIYYIKQVLVRSEAIIEALAGMLSKTPEWSDSCSLENTKKCSANEVVTCIRILDTEGRHI